MNKNEYLEQLRKELCGLPQDDIEERLSFYEEMIEDRMEEGLSEEDAIRAVGTVSDIVTQIVADVPLAKLAKERIKPKRRMTAWEIVLLSLGSPIWLSIGISIVAIIISIYVSLWSIIISLWSVFGSLVGCVIGCLAGGTLFICTNHVFTGVVGLAASLVCSGLSIFMFYGCKLATKGLLKFTKNFAIWIKHCFIKKEEV